MSFRGKILILGLMYSAIVWGLIAYADEAPLQQVADKITVISWVHIWGCPRPASDVVLWVKDGSKIKVVHLKVDKLSKMEQDKLLEMIGDVEGININYKCGNEI